MNIPEHRPETPDEIRTHMEQLYGGLVGMDSYCLGYLTGAYQELWAKYQALKETHRAPARLNDSRELLS